MAQQITRLLPFRDENGHEIINIFSYDAASGEAGTFVKVARGDLNLDTVSYVTRGVGAWDGTQGNATSLYPENPLKVTACVGTGDAGRVIGMLYRDIREADENNQNLLYYPEKKAELQCVASGETVPILKRGVVAMNSRGFTNGAVPNVGDSAVLAANGTVTGVAPSALSTEQRNVVVGKFLGTGNRVSQQDTDSHAGAWAILDLSV